MISRIPQLALIILAMSTLPETVTAADDRDAAFDAAAEALKQAGDVDRLFDLRMLHAKMSLGAPIGRPETLSDVPREQRSKIEESYRSAAREAGQALLDAGDPVRAFSYFHAIGEDAAVREAFEAMPVRPGDHPEADYERDQELANIALFEGAHPRKGVEMLLALVGTCSTITSLDQALPQMSPKDRSECAETMVRSLHADLMRSVTADVEQRAPLLRPAKTLNELLVGRDELFQGGNYHVDVSHLSSVVRFARSIEPPSDALSLAIDLCDYGRQLDPTLQYGSEPPFDTFYPAHRHFLAALDASSNGEAGPIDAAEAYFREKLAAEPDVPDQRLIAYVLTDLLVRCGRAESAVALASEHLADAQAETGFSFAELCQNTGQLDKLAEYSQERGDVLGYLAGKFAEPAAND